MLNRWFLGVLSLFTCLFATSALADPTAGFTQVSWTPDIQSPYNLPHTARYTNVGGTGGLWHLWVFNTDQPFSQGNTTKPRTELRFNPDYTSGSHQFEADYLVPTGTNSVAIFQIHTGDAESDQYGSTTFMTFVEGNELCDYSGTTIANNILNNWFHLNVIHNLNNHTIQCYFNNKLSWTQKDNGANDFYFKCGVYMQEDGRGTGSHEMQDYIKNITLWQK